MSFELINDIKVGDIPSHNYDEPTIIKPCDLVHVNITTKYYKSDDNITVTTGINREPVEFSMSGPGYLGKNWMGETLARYTITFVMPFGHVVIEGSFTTKWEEDEMDNIDITMIDVSAKRNEDTEKVRSPGPDGVIDTFTIPEELAQELSDLLIKQSIRQNSVNSCVGDPEKYEQAEALLLPIAARVDKIKHQISTELVPKKYRSSKYRWNFNGWEIDNNVLQIMYA